MNEQLEHPDLVEDRRWTLVDIRDDHRHSTWADDLCATFERRLRRLGGERLTVVVESDGLTKVYRNGVLMRTKRRALCHAACCQANAYVKMTGSVDGFPRQSLI